MPLPKLHPWALAGIGVGQIRNLLNGDIEQRRPPVNRSNRSGDISFSKALRGRVGSGWVGLGRVGSDSAYSDLSLKAAAHYAIRRAECRVRGGDNATFSENGATFRLRGRRNSKNRRRMSLMGVSVERRKKS